MVFFIFILLRAEFVRQHLESPVLVQLPDDDSILCEDESDGIVFKVSATDLRVRRCIEFQKIGVGSVVVVSFTDPVIAGEDGCTIDSAISVARGYVSGGDVTVPE